MSPKTATRISAAIVVLAVLILLPIPLLPPPRLVELIQSSLGIGGGAAYLICAIAVQAQIYFVLGILATFIVNRPRTWKGRVLQTVTLPLVVVGVAFMIRSLRAGQVPIWSNAAIPVAACVGGVILGLSFLYHRWKLTACLLTILTGLAAWAVFAGASSELRLATEENLRRIVAAGPGLPTGDARFGALLRTAFANSETSGSGMSAVEHNRAAILAFGIAVGHRNVARLIGLSVNSDLVRNAVAVGQGATLNRHEDWPRHYAVSAALAILKHPLLSDAGGLMKEQLDTLTRGSGFSFGDLAADRAGVRFALAATRSETAARAMQTRLHAGFFADDFFPADVHFPENLSIGEFRRSFGIAGSERYQSVVSDIDASLDRCSALSLD